MNRIFDRRFFLPTLFALLLFLLIAPSVFAQCDGIYFKPAQRKILQNRFYFNGDRRNVKDVTGDGKLDIVGTNILDNNRVQKILILPGDGSGGFGSASEITLAAEGTDATEAFLVADFNGDGKNDIIIKQATTPQTVVVYQNNGSGTFTALPPTTITSGENLLNLLDINNDGKGDLLTSFGARYYRLANADGTFGNRVQFTAGEGIPADYNGDGKIDFAITELISSNYRFKIYYNQGGGIFNLSGELLNLGESNAGTDATDFNADGKPDLVFRSFVGGNLIVTVVKNLGNNAFSKTDYPVPSLSGSNPQIADLDGNGSPDIYLQHSLPNVRGNYAALINDGAGNFTLRNYSAPQYLATLVGDLDGDAKADKLRFINYQPFPENFTGRPIFNDSFITTLKNVCNTFGQTKIVDFDKDTVTDRTMWRASDGRWRRRTSAIDSQSSFNWGSNGDVPVPGDYDGDGATDIAVYRPSNGYWYIVNSSNGSFSFTQFGVAEDKTVASDYNGDGRTDIAVYRPSVGDWYLLYSGTNQFVGLHFGIAEDKPVPEDYDGDGKSDIAVYRPTGGYWYLLRSSDGSFAATKWGINSDNPLPGDFDGDGKADLTVYRAAEGNWYVLRSFNSQYGIFQYGVSTDVPQVGDFNGNGIMGINVYRPSDKKYYVFPSSQTFPFGEDGETPISSIIKVQ